MKIENVEVVGFRHAFRGMRNPFNSWGQSNPESDLKLARKLVKAGSDHRKFLRMIVIYGDLTLPRYMWTELDTYKVATVRNSCSTMNTLCSRPIVQSDFEESIPDPILEFLNCVREEHGRLSILRSTEAKVDAAVAHRRLKNVLPEGYLQKATYMFNYETALNIYFARRNHRLPCWHTFCEWLETLPYFADFIKAAEGK